MRRVPNRGQASVRFELPTEKTACFQGVRFPDPIPSLPNASKYPGDEIDFFPQAFDSAVEWASRLTRRGP